MVVQIKGREGGNDKKGKKGGAGIPGRRKRPCKADF